MSLAVGCSFRLVSSVSPSWSFSEMVSCVGRVAVVGGVEHAPLSFVAQRVEGHKPRLEVFSRCALSGFPSRPRGPQSTNSGTFSIRTHRTSNLVSQLWTAQGFILPWSWMGFPPLALEWYLHSGDAIKMFKVATLDDLLRVHDADVFDQVAGGGVICLVGGYGRVPVVDGHQVHLPAQLGYGVLGSG